MSIYTIYWLRDNTHTDPYIEGYVGVTTRDPQLRLHEHLISKEYIPDTYVFDILRQVDTKEEMLSIERLYRPTDHIGWNIAKGGGARPSGIHTSGWSHTEESKEQRRTASMGESNPMYGKTTSDKQKKAVSESASKRFKGVPKNYKVHSPDTRGALNGMSRVVLVGDQRYDTVTEAAEAHGVSRVTARRRLTVDTFPDWNYE